MLSHSLAPSTEYGFIVRFYSLRVKISSVLIHLVLGQFEGKEARCFDLEYMIGLVVIYFAGLVWRFIFLFAISVFFFFFG